MEHWMSELRDALNNGMYPTDAVADVLEQAIEDFEYRLRRALQEVASDWEDEECGDCGGSGACDHCDGKGSCQEVERNEEGEYVHPEHCSYCDGTGNCEYCDGTGNCVECDGTGNAHNFD